jgi:hypothetical protein
MHRDDWKRIKGLKRLLHEGVQNGADFVEKHHRLTAAKPFEVLEAIDTIAEPTKAVRSVHDGVLSLTYGGIRLVNQATEVADDWVLNQLAPGEDGPETKHES